MIRTRGLILGWLLAGALALSGLNGPPPAPSASSEVVAVEAFESYDRLDAINWAIWDIWRGELSLAKINEVYQTAPRPLLLESGEGFIAWRDVRSGSDRLYLQHVDERGNRLWQHDLEVTQNSGNPGADALLPAPGGGVYVIFADEREGRINAYLQRFSPQGERQWAEDVKITRPPITSFLHLTAKLTAQGEVAVAWSSNRQLYLQKFTSTGGRAWVDDLKVNREVEAVDDVTDFGLGAGPGGDLLAAWFSPESDLLILAQRIRTDGMLAWEAPAAVAAIVDNNRNGGVDVAFGEDGSSFIAWVDTTEDNRTHSAVFGQRLGPGGNVLWSAARQLSAENRYFFQNGIHLALVGDTSLRLWWTARHTDGRNNVFWQKFSPDGTLAHTQDQLLIEPAPYPDDNYTPYASFDQAGSALVGYEYYQYITAQKISSAGEILTRHPALVKELSGETRLDDPRVATGAGGDTWLLWHDSRMGPGQKYIFFQHFTAGGDRLIPDGQGLAQGITSSWNPAQAMIAAAPEGRAAVAWEYFAAPDRREIRVQLLEANGAFVWGDFRLARPATNTDLALGALEVDAGGNIFVAWSGAGETHVQKLSPGGALLWGSGVKINANPEPDPQVWEVGRHGIALDSGQDGTLHLAWIEQLDRGTEFGHETLRNIYAQRLGADGAHLWEEDTLVNSGELGESFPQKLAFGAAADSTSVILWSMWDTAWMQKLSPQGERLFAEDQPILEGVDSHLYSAEISKRDDDGKFYLTWAEHLTGVYAQRMDENGTLLWPMDVLVSQPHPEWYYDPPKLSAGLASASITWSAGGEKKMIFLNRVSQGGRRLWAHDEPAITANSFYQRDGYAQSRQLNTGSAPILAARLDASYETVGGNIRFYLSNNGGASWEEVEPFERHVFRHTGADIRWRVGLRPSENLHNSPVIRSITVTYETEPPFLIDNTIYLPFVIR